MRLVIDTNVLINAYDDDFSSSAKLLNAIAKGDITALLTSATKLEYQNILQRLIPDQTYQDRVNHIISHMHSVTPEHVSVTIDDHEDLKFIAAAVGGQADALVTNDRHLLDIGEINQIPIITPHEAWIRFDENSGSSSEWNQWMQGLGL